MNFRLLPPKIAKKSKSKAEENVNFKIRFEIRMKNKQFIQITWFNQEIAEQQKNKM